MFHVYVDGIDIIATKEMKEAFALFLASFYIFNIAYPPKIEKSLQFYQKMFLQLDDSVPRRNAVIKLMNRVNRIKVT